VIDHAQPETDDFSLRHGNSKASGNDNSQARGNDNPRPVQRQPQARGNDNPKLEQRQPQAGATTTPSWSNDNPKLPAKATHKPFATASPSRALLTGIDPIPLRFSRPPEIAAEMDHRASSTRALGLEISE
jgi:hypothetical protein